MKKLRLCIAVSIGALLALPLVSCSPNDPSAPVISGSPTYTPIRVVALGNSLTAGYMNGGLRMDGQMAGYANLVATQVTTALTGSARTMNIPLVAPPGIGGTAGQGPLYVSAAGALTSDALTVNPLSLLLAARLPQPYDNLGVPGATTLDVTQATSSANSQAPGNSFFDAILRNSALPPGDTTQLDQLEALVNVGLPRTLVLMLWIGNNDILGGASGGDPVVGVNVTPNADFGTMLAGILDRIDALGVPMKAIANIPSITSAPYFTAVPLRFPDGTGGFLPPWNTDESDVALVLLPAQTSVLLPSGSPNPDYLPGGSESLPSNLTLTNAEIAAVEAEVAAYNGLIATAAGDKGYALVDVNAVLAGLPNNPLDPSTYAVLNAAYPLQPDLVNGGLFQNTRSAFSLDGVHPSEKGYAGTANAFLAAMNTEFGQSFPLVDVDAVSNVAGFEQFGVALPTARGPRIDERAARVLRDLPRTLGAR